MSILQEVRIQAGSARTSRSMRAESDYTPLPVKQPEPEYASVTVLTETEHRAARIQASCRPIGLLGRFAIGLTAMLAFPALAQSHFVSIAKQYCLRYRSHAQRRNQWDIRGGKPSIARPELSPSKYISQACGSGIAPSGTEGDPTLRRAMQDWRWFRTGPGACPVIARGMLCVWFD